MSHNLDLAQHHALDLARILLVPITLFEVDGEFGVMPSADLEEDEVTVIREYDPWAPAR